MTVDEFSDYLQKRGKADEVSGLIDKLGFTREFIVANVLNRKDRLTVAQTAMLWMGMPNKHDRKKAHQLFDALTEAGLLEADAQGESWRSTVG